MRPDRLRWAAAWVIASLLLALCFRGVDIRGLLVLVAGAHHIWLGAALSANATILLLWATQWWWLLPRARPVPFRRVLGVTAMMAMVANSVPFLAGQAAGVHLLATRGSIGHAGALSVAALDQLAEGIAKVTMLLVLATLAPLPPSLATALNLLAMAVALLLTIVVVAAWSHGRLRISTGLGRVHPGIARFVTEWAAGLEGARRPTVLAGGVLLALTMKGAELTGILTVQLALGVDLPAWSALAVLAAVSLSTIVSAAPANLGVYEGSAFLAYRALGVTPETALALGVVQHALYLIPMAGAGWLAVTLGRRESHGALAAMTESAGD